MLFHRIHVNFKFTFRQFTSLFISLNEIKQVPAGCPFIFILFNNEAYEQENFKTM